MNFLSVEFQFPNPVRNHFKDCKNCIPAQRLSQYYELSQVCGISWYFVICLKFMLMTTCDYLKNLCISFSIIIITENSESTPQRIKSVGKLKKKNKTTLKYILIILGYFRSMLRLDSHLNVWHYQQWYSSTRQLS